MIIYYGRPKDKLQREINVVSVYFVTFVNAEFIGFKKIFNCRFLGACKFSLSITVMLNHSANYFTTGNEFKLRSYIKYKLSRVLYPSFICIPWKFPTSPEGAWEHYMASYFILPCLIVITILLRRIDGKTMTYFSLIWR